MKKFTKAQLEELNKMSISGYELIEKWENDLKTIEKKLRNLTNKKPDEINNKDIKSLLTQAIKPVGEIQKIYSELSYKIYDIAEAN